MIPVNELRIGSWLVDEHGRQYQVDGHEMYQVDTMPEYRELWYGIALTPAVLERCDRVIKEDFEGEADNIYWIELSKDEDEYLNEILIQWDYDGNLIVTVDGIVVPCPYLHTLQNLFLALTGAELNYKPI